MHSEALVEISFPGSAGLGILVRSNALIYGIRLMSAINDCRCIPIATIFPPATLSVANASENITSMLKVPQYDFTTFDFVAPMASNIMGGANTLDLFGLPTENGLWAWSGPSQPLQNLASAAMALGQILPITAPAPNASWTLDFWGPLLQCNDVIGMERDQIWTNIWNSYNRDGNGSHAFLSWVPWSPNWVDLIDDTSGQSRKPSNCDLPFQYDDTVFGSSPWQLSIDGPASLFVAVLPEAQRLLVSDSGNSTLIGYKWTTEWEYCPIPTLRTLTDPLILNCGNSNISFTPSLIHDDSTLLRCDLRNSSYSIEMNYVNGLQDIRVSANRTGISPLVNGTEYFFGPNWNLSESSNCTSFLAPPYSGGNCVFDVSAMHLLSYQGIMTAFNQLILGDIRIGEDAMVNMNTTTLKTILARTDELAFLRNLQPSLNLDTKKYLQTAISNMTNDAYSGLLNTSPPRVRADLKTTLEQLFQNFTVSLLSEPYFQ